MPTESGMPHQRSTVNEPCALGTASPTATAISSVSATQSVPRPMVAER